MSEDAEKHEVHRGLKGVYFDRSPVCYIDGRAGELLYRGYLPWFFAPWLGSVGAMALVVVLFCIGHAYQGRSGTVKATLAGAFMAALVLVTNSLIPAMIVHALIDIGSGTLGYWLLRDDPNAPSPLPRNAATATGVMS